MKSRTERAREMLERQRVISITHGAFDALAAALSEQEVRPATRLAASAITEYAASVREDGTLDW